MREIYTLRQYVTDPRFRICLCELELAEYSVECGKECRKKLDRIPLALRRIVMLDTPADFSAFLPEPLPEPLTAPALAKAVHTPVLPVRLYLNLLGSMGILAEAGRSGRLKCWKRTGSDAV
jgi:hypothetical protein